MTSQLNVDTIVDKAGSGGTNVKVANTSTYVSDGGNVTQNTVQGLAKAWCDHKTAATFVLENSFNVSSLTDLHTGSADVNITNNMDNVHSAATGGGGGGTGYSGVIIPNAWCFATNKFMVVTYWVDLRIMTEIILMEYYTET